MKPIHIAATFVKLFAIYIIFYLIVSGFSLVPYITSNQEQLGASPLIIITLILAMLFVAIFAWFFPISITKKLIGNIDNDETELSFSSNEFAEICIFAVALYLLAGLLGETVYWFNLLSDSSYREMAFDQNNHGITTKADLWSYSARLIFTLYLIIGNKQVVRLFRKLRQ